MNPETENTHQKMSPLLPHSDHPPKSSTEHEISPGFGSLFSLLLRQPLDFFQTLQQRNQFGLWTTQLILMIFGGLLVFGLVLSTFSAGNQLWAVPLKICMGTTFAALICFPSLLIFSALGGVEERVAPIFFALLATLGLTSLLLLGFAPVVWLFSVSSSSIGFVGFLALLVWTCSCYFGFKLLFQLLYLCGLRNVFPLGIWCLIFLLVTFQLTTTLRPLLGDYYQFLDLGDKRFFLDYWVQKCFS